MKTWITFTFLLINLGVKAEIVPNELKFLFSLHTNIESADLGHLQKMGPRLIAEKLDSEETFLQKYDDAFMNTQMECHVRDDLNEIEKRNCDDLLSFYYSVNDILNGEEETTVGTLDWWLPGINDALDGHKHTEWEVKKSDPNYELLMSSNQTPGRFSPLNKGDFREVNEKLKIQKTTDLNCFLEKRNKLNIQAEFLKEIVSELEQRLTSETSSLTEKKEIYCTLMSFYEETENHDQIIMFLLLNAPEGNNFCE